MVRSINNPFKEDQSRCTIFNGLVLGFVAAISLLFFMGDERTTTNNDNKFPQPKKEPSLLVVTTTTMDDDEKAAGVVVPTVSPTVDLFPFIEEIEFPNWLARHYSKLEFHEHTIEQRTYKLNRDILQESLLLGCNNIVNNQKSPQGNFNYQYDFVTQKMDPDDSPVRQAGALWGLTLCFQNQPTNKNWQAAVEKGIDFFLGHLEEGPVHGSTMVRYPGYEQSDAGANALLGLALVDYLRTIQDHQIEVDVEKEQKYQTQLASTIQFLKFLRLPNQSFAKSYKFASKTKATHGSPYYDGETMLCLTKAARYLPGYKETLVPLIEEAAFVLAKRYTLDVWRNDEDSDQTKGFYQWSSMFMWEYWHAQWKDYEVAGDYVMTVGHWIIYVHEILERPRNTGYAFEGLVCAYDIAFLRGYKAAHRDYAFAIDRGLYQLTHWQVGGPLSSQNAFLTRHLTNDPLAIGGVMNAKNQSPLRIDTTQHQMHAVMMAMEFLYAVEVSAAVTDDTDDSNQ